MVLPEILLVKLGTRLGKFLFKTYLGKPGELFGDDLAEISKGQIEKLLERREAARVFERLGEHIAAQLLPLFEDAATQGGLAVEAVVTEVEAALDGRVSSEVLVGKDLDPAKLLAELRAAHPLPLGQFSAAEEACYDRVLAEAVRYLVEVAAQLPRFEKAAVAESLKRLWTWPLSPDGGPAFLDLASIPGRRPVVSKSGLYPRTTACRSGSGLHLLEVGSAPVLCPQPTGWRSRNACRRRPPARRRSPSPPPRSFAALRMTPPGGRGEREL